MTWTIIFIGIIFSISNINGQYVIRRDMPPLSQNLPYTNVPVYTNQITPRALQNNNVVVADNPLTYNNEDVAAKLVTAIEKLALANNVLSSLNTILNDYVEPAAKLVKTSDITGVGAPVINNNTPLTRLRVPIVKEVPIGALLVARNLPIANLAAVPGVPNNVQVFGNRVNYQNVNNAPNIPLNRFYRAPVNAITTYDPRRLTTNFVSSPWNIQRIPYDNRVPYNVRNIPLSNIVPTTNYLRRPITNLPITSANIARALVTNIGTAPIGNYVANPPYSYTTLQRPSINLNNIGNLRVNDLNNIPFDRFADWASNTIARLPIASTRISEGYGQVTISSGVNKVIANVPIVPLNSLAALPVYKGLPVIRVSESVYKLTPVNP